MATKERLEEEWADFVKRASKDQLQKLRDAGIVNPADPEDGEFPQFHRYIDRYLGKEEKVVGWLYSRIAKPCESDDPDMNFAMAVAARVIDAFDCSVEPEIKLHCDCFRLALGFPSCGSQKEVASKHGMSKAAISFRVRVIQRRLKLPTGAFNGPRAKP